MDRTGDSMLAFLLGAIAGGVAALLLAPASGEETRRRLREASGQIYDQGRGAVDRAKDEVEERAQSVTDLARGRVQAVKEAVAEGKQAYRKELEKG
jgi:gas vesicle protein